MPTENRQCPKCLEYSGDHWGQCKGQCPMPMSPHFNVETARQYQKRAQGDVFDWISRALTKENEKMMSVIAALEAIEAADLGNSRREVLKAHDSPRLREVLNLALSPDLTFGVKALPEPEPDGFTFCDEGEWYGTLKALTRALSERRATGGKARESISSFLGHCQNDLQRKWTERILRQDLRLNLGAKDVNNVLGEGTIKIFALPLATAVFDSKRKFKLKPKDLKGIWRKQAKEDGGRAVAFLPANRGRVRMLSRTGKEWGNFESVRRVLQEYNERREGQNETLVLDGEVVSIVDGRIDFNAIQQNMQRKDGVEIGDLHYHVFSACDEEEWYACRKNYDTLLVRAEAQVSFIDNPKVQVIPDFGIVVDPTPEFLEEEAQRFVEMGYEGLILRRPDKPIDMRRGKDLLKVKLFDTAEAVIVGVAPGAPHTKNEGTLGALVCETIANEDLGIPGGIRFEVGGGFNPDRYRDVLWGRRETLPGQIVTYAFFGLSKDNVPRHPQYRGIRAPEDCG